jgi:protein arginine N-methyltransferase 7
LYVDNISNLFYRFNFGAQAGKPIPVNEQTSVISKALRDGKCDAVLMWWDIFMDPDKKVLLSCAPKWAHPAKDDLVRYDSSFFKY